MEIITIKKAINHKYDIRAVYKIKTNEWFKDMEFLSIDSLNKFVEGLK